VNFNVGVKVNVGVNVMVGVRVGVSVIVGVRVCVLVGNNAPAVGTAVATNATWVGVGVGVCGVSSCDWQATNKRINVGIKYFRNVIVIK
jgi:hypothetical protein